MGIPPLGFFFLFLTLLASGFSKKHFHGIETRAACDIYPGRWVYDESYPLYDSASCPFIRREYDCLKYGRPDKEYLKYRWKPEACEIPRFDGKDLLERWRGKRVMFVGDSLSLNQYESFLCMIHAAVVPGAMSNATTTANGGLTVVVIEGYNVSIEYYLTRYLVDIVREDIGRVLKLDSIEGGHVWVNADMLIFNTWHWWPRSGPSQPWDYIQDGEHIYKDMDRSVAFSKAMETWAKWVDSNVKSTAKRVLFQGISPNHYRGVDWGEPNATCSSETRPVNGSTYPTSPLPQQAIVNNVLSSMSKHVDLLDITLLSQLRKDAHPSKYNGIHLRMDCSHWCIAGLPDTWNQLLYAALL